MCVHHESFYDLHSELGHELHSASLQLVETGGRTYWRQICASELAKVDDKIVLKQKGVIFNGKALNCTFVHYHLRIIVFHSIFRVEMKKVFRI